MLITNSADALARLERMATSHSHRKVRNLSISLKSAFEQGEQGCQSKPSLIIINGRAETYYVKQLAQHGVMNELDDNPAILAALSLQIRPDIDNQIRVA